MNKRTSFSDMTKIVGERLNIDPHRLQFFKAYQQSLVAPPSCPPPHPPPAPYSSYATSDRYHTSPSTAIKCNYGGTLADIFICYKPKQAFRLYYEQVTIAVSELEQKKQVRCIWFSNKQKEIVSTPSSSSSSPPPLHPPPRHPLRNVSSTPRLLEQSPISYTKLTRT